MPNKYYVLDSEAPSYEEAIDALTREKKRKVDAAAWALLGFVFVLGYIVGAVFG